jgi:formate dehydrogenase subunit gamma
MGLEDRLSRDHCNLRPDHGTRRKKPPRVCFRKPFEIEGEDGMAKLIARVRYIAAALTILIALAFAAPLSAQQPTSVNPSGAAVKEEQLFQQMRQLQGRITIPNSTASVLEQPAGRDWRAFHQETLRWIGGIAIVGMFLLLVIFYSIRGTIKLTKGRSGRTITRFNGFERFTHWLTASTFIILALSGLNITFGKALLLPVMGPEAFATLSQWGKYFHNYLSFAFAIGLVFTFLIWIKDNIPGGADVEWLKRGGGMVGNDHPPAPRFNAGQKIIYWLVVFGGAAIAISGYYLMFPFYGAGIEGMQLAAIVHGVVSVLLIAVMLAHIYIGTLGMEGAFEAMGTGEVDLNWAKEHHSIWVDEAMGGPEGARARATPAE